MHKRGINMAAIEKVINLADKRPHLAGKAKCLDCKHMWMAIAPIGTLWLECPNCGLMRGRVYADVQRDGLHWHCKCGFEVFYVTPDGYYCPNCGAWQTGY